MEFCHAFSMRKAVTALCILGLVVAIVIGLGQARDRTAGPAASKPLSRAEVSRPIAGVPPRLAALRRQVNVLLGGGTQAFDAQLRALRGYPVVVNMWASWCGPCRLELPLLQREALARSGKVAFLGVNVNDGRDDAQRLAARYPMPYPSFADPRANIAAGRFRSQALPVTAFYDARGKLAIRHQGQFASRAELAAAIDRYALHLR